MTTKDTPPLSEPGSPLYEAALQADLNPIKLHKHKGFNIPPKGQPKQHVWNPGVEPDWDAIAKLTAENDAKEAKAAELTAMKAKLMGKK
jgi:hypothetical protein